MTTTASEPEKTVGWHGTPFYPGYTEIKEALPGFLLVVLPIAIVSEVLWVIEINLHKTFFVDIFIAAVLAILVTNVVPLPQRLQPGLAFSTRWFLRAGIIIYGLKFSYASLLQSGIQDLTIVITTVVIAVGVSMLLGKLLGVNPHIAALIGTGTAICGVAAAMAISPTMRAKDEETAIALSTILFWGTLGLLLYPLISGFLHLSPTVYGAWTGASLHDLPQIVAAAAQGGGAAGLKAALFVKLIRVAFIVVIAIFMSVVFGLREGVQEARNSGRSIAVSALKTFPLFVLTFFIVVLLNTLFQIPATIAGPLATWPVTIFPTTVSAFFLTLAIIGICARVTRPMIRVAGFKAMLLALITWVTQSVVILILASTLLH
ncbi:MAG: putative sulfate exporter family transporter [Ktedonobacteraceae bacterium]